MAATTTHMSPPNPATPVDDLVAFVRARIAEERAVAEEAAGSRPMVVGSALETELIGGVYVVQGTGANLVLDVRQDPAATLARLDALTALVDMHSPVDTTFGRLCHECRWRCATMLRLAAIWRDHADYRRGWVAG